MLLAGSGPFDSVAAAEGALKLKEATYVWAEGTSTELALHGPPAAMRPGMGAVRPFATVVPLQRLAAELARLCGTSPDSIHRDLEPWRSAMP